MTFTATNASRLRFQRSQFSHSDANPKPELQSIVSSTCVTGRAGQPFAFQVLTNYASTEERLAATGLPYEEGMGPQMTIDPGTGLISGMVPRPRDADDMSKSFGVGLKLTDGDASQSYLQLTFVSNPAFPVITSKSNAALTLNKFFSYTITADARTLLGLRWTRWKARRVVALRFEFRSCNRDDFGPLPWRGRTFRDGWKGSGQAKRRERFSHREGGRD